MGTKYGMNIEQGMSNARRLHQLLGTQHFVNESPMPNTQFPNAPMPCPLTKKGDAPHPPAKANKQVCFGVSFVVYATFLKQVSSAGGCSLFETGGPSEDRHSRLSFEDRVLAFSPSGAIC
jgi:hypothetical protein